MGGGVIYCGRERVRPRAWTLKGQHQTSKLEVVEESEKAFPSGEGAEVAYTGAEEERSLPNRSGWILESIPKYLYNSETSTLLNLFRLASRATFPGGEGFGSPARQTPISHPIHPRKSIQKGV